MFFPRAKADRQIGGIPTVAFRPRSWRRLTTFRTRDISYTQTKQMTFSCLLEPDSKVIAQSTNRHSTTWWSHHCAFHQSTHYHMAITSSCIPPVSQHTITWLSHHRAFHQSTHYHMAITSSSIPPVNTLPHGYHIIEHSTSQHTTTWLSHHRAFHQSAHYHMAITSSSIPPVSTLSHGYHIEHPTSQHTTTWLSHHRAFHQSAIT